MTEDERKAMEWLDAWARYKVYSNKMADAYRALYAHLTAPKIKEVEVECWGVLTEAGVAGSYFDERSARNDTMVKEGAGHVVRLTGRATVPA